jgi:hypothetical protein
VGDEDCAEVFVQAELEVPNLVLEIGFRSKVGGVELFQRVGDAFGLRAREAPLFEFIDDAVGVDHQCLHISSVYQRSGCLQEQAFRRCHQENGGLSPSGQTLGDLS